MVMEYYNITETGKIKAPPKPPRSIKQLNREENILEMENSMRKIQRAVSNEKGGGEEEGGEGEGGKGGGTVSEITKSFELSGILRLK